MEGELHDFKYPKYRQQYGSREKQSGYIMVAALCWLGIYYLFLKPFGLCVASAEAISAYDDTGLVCR